ncbi:multiple antibiotic resistance (MarC)-related protein [Desulfarculus baarsii DSM 2075]|uniref:UPF0056 inner membrane protein n=2 Tax=Desulfarculus baarsii TaxID=453230 RepID=E1QKV6_DESB2|nr:multiple antibiotic resistance (MarC)-related protein [Desulfarculus baarsii DSM 2075]
MAPMTDLIDDFLRQFTVFWATIDPISTLGLFLAITPAKSAREKRSIAMRATLYSAIILLGFVMVGQIILTYMEIRLQSFQIAGGILLFLFGVQMVFGDAAPPPDQKPEAGHDVAVFPLAIPSIASPGAIMAAVLMTENSSHTTAMQCFTLGVMGVVLLITLVLMLMANKVFRLLGNAGSAVVVRVMGILLSAMAVETVIHGLGGLGLIPIK